MITPEPPAGSEHYREGWRHGYEQAAIDRERSAGAVRLVPDTGQPPAPDPECPACRGSGRDRPLTPEEIAEQTAMTIAALKSPATGQAPESPTDSTPKAGRCGSSDTETTTDTGQVRDVATLTDVEARTQAAAAMQRVAEVFAVDHPGTAQQARLWATGFERGDWFRWLEAARALLGTDTTPDRLAWISEASETAAAQRQARYQETACARRPAATSGDPAPPALAYARSEVDKWLADRDPYCILPTRTEHIPALLARLDELEGTS